MGYTIHVHGNSQLRIVAKGSYLTNYLLDSRWSDTTCLSLKRELEMSQGMWLFSSLNFFTWYHDVTSSSELEISFKIIESLHLGL